MLNDVDIAHIKVIFNKINFERLVPIATGSAPVALQVQIGLKWKVDSMEVEGRAAILSFDVKLTSQIFNININGSTNYQFYRAIPINELSLLESGKILMKRNIDYIILLIASTTNDMGTSPLLIEKNILINSIDTSQNLA